MHELVPTLSSRSADHSVCMIDRRNLGYPIHEFEDHKAAVLCVQWCPDKSSVFESSAEDGCLNIWDDEKERVKECKLIYQSCMEDFVASFKEKCKARMPIKSASVNSIM